MRALSKEEVVSKYKNDYYKKKQALRCNEAHTLFELRDLEDLIVKTMGVDVWLAIMYFTEKKIEDNQQDDDIRSYDAALYAIRGDVRDAIEEIDKLEYHVINGKRLNRLDINKRLECIKNQLKDSEGL